MEATSNRRAQINGRRRRATFVTEPGLLTHSRLYAARRISMGWIALLAELILRAC